MQRVRYLAVALLSAAIVIFAVQNLQPVLVEFLAWRFQTSVTLVTLVPFLSGLLAGALTAFLARRLRRPGEPPPRPGPAPPLSTTQENEVAFGP